MRKVIALFLLGACVFLTNVMGASAASVPMKLDPTFGLNGVVLADYAGVGWEDEPFHLIQQSDGKYAVPGKAHNDATDFDFIVARFKNNGPLDKTFNGTGMKTLDIMGGYDEALGLVQQPDGKLVAAGFATDPNTGLEDMALVRLNTDGSVDTSFGNNGIVITDFAGGNDRALGLVIQSDDKLVAGGYTESATTDLDFALARYNTNGTLDATYGVGGRVSTDFFGSADAIQRLAIQPDDKVVGVGVTLSTATNSADFAIGRYNTNGTLDTTFAASGAPGIAATDFLGGTDSALTVFIQPDGKILAGGLAFNPVTGDYDAALAKYNANGTIDNTFATYGAPGLLTMDYFGQRDQFLALAVQPDGKIIAAGHARHPIRSYDFALGRFTKDGNPDASFGIGGRLTTDFFGGPDGLHGMVLEETGTVTVAGDVLNPLTAGDDFALARYLVADPTWIAAVVMGMPDVNFSINGRIGTLVTLVQAQQDISAGSTASAINRLRTLRDHVNGCLPSPDPNDWIVECGGQMKVRTLVDQVIVKLGGTIP